MSKQSSAPILHETWPLLSHLSGERPELRFPMAALGITDPSVGRYCSASRKAELAPLAKPLLSCSRWVFLSVFGCLSIHCMVGLPEIGQKIGRTVPALYIIGNDCRVEGHSFGTISREMMRYLNISEFMPDPFCRKIVYLFDWTGGHVQGHVFSELSKGLWTTDDPMHLPVTSVSKTGPSQILRAIIDDMKEG